MEKRTLSDYQGDYGRVQFQIKRLQAQAQWLEEKMVEIEQQQQAEMFKKMNKGEDNEKSE